GNPATRECVSIGFPDDRAQIRGSKKGVTNMCRTTSMRDPSAPPTLRPERGELADLLLPHLDSAYNLARWLLRSAEDAEDVVQGSFLRAVQSSGFRGGNVRAWLLTIVRNASYDRIRKRTLETEYDEQVHTSGIGTANPEQLLLKNADRQRVENALCDLPV